MFNKKIALTAGLLCCFFENIQGGMNREQLEKKMGKPVHLFVQMIDFVPVDQWFYTTELSKILLVGEHPAIEFCRALPIVGSSIVPLFAQIESIWDNRFEHFIGNIGKYSQYQLQEAILDTLVLTGGSSKAYSRSRLLDYLEDALQRKIDLIQNQLTYDYQYDQKSVHSMERSVAYAAGLIAFIFAVNTYAKYDDKEPSFLEFLHSDNINLDFKDSSVAGLYSMACLGSLPISYYMLKSSYEVLTKDPHALNQYLKEYQDLFEFVHNLNSRLKTDGCIIFTLNNRNTVTITQHDWSSFLFARETVDFS